MASGSKLVIYAALAGNVGIAVTKFVAAAIAGSSSMLTEGIHSLVDSTNQLLMLYGRHRSQAPPDDLHPLGHGRELYFWAFLVALLIFTAGAGISVYEGVIHIVDPHPITDWRINFAVLAIAALFEGTSLFFAVREFRKQRDPEDSYWRSLRESKDPSVFVVLLEDSAALAGLLVAAICIGLAVSTRNPLWDGVGSMVIGTILGIVAAVLARETKHLLIGERATEQLRTDLRRAAEQTPEVCFVNEVITMQMAPKEVVATLSIQFKDGLLLAQIERVIEGINARMVKKHPELRRLFIHPRASAREDP